MSWRPEQFDWASLRSANSAEGVGHAILQLVNASSLEEADDAYWRIDNEVIVQGALFEAATSVAWCLACGLLHCTDLARPFLLELLVQLCSGEPHPTEVQLGNSTIAEDCIFHASMASVVYFDCLEQGIHEEIGHAVDLIGLCAEENVNLQHLAVRYFERLLKREPAAQMASLISDLIADFSAET